MKTCHACRKQQVIERKAGRSETCPHCGADLHVCLNCCFYNPGAYNECREPQAERVVEKKRSNFCDFFHFADGSLGNKEAPRTGDTRDRLDALFKKPS
jgi:hypothetical protein